MFISYPGAMHTNDINTEGAEPGATVHRSASLLSGCSYMTSEGAIGNLSWHRRLCFFHS